MPTTQVHELKNAPCEKVKKNKNDSSPWPSKSALKSSHGRGGAEAEVFFEKRLPTGCCFPGTRHRAGLGQPKPGRDKHLPFRRQPQTFLNIRHFPALAMRTPPGVGCISFPSGLLGKASSTLRSFGCREGGTPRRVGTNAAPPPNRRFPDRPALSSPGKAARRGPSGFDALLTPHTLPL